MIRKGSRTNLAYRIGDGQSNEDIMLTEVYRSIAKRGLLPGGKPIGRSSHHLTHETPVNNYAWELYVGDKGEILQVGFRFDLPKKHMGDKIMPYITGVGNLTELNLNFMSHSRENRVQALEVDVLQQMGVPYAVLEEEVFSGGLSELREVDTWSPEKGKSFREKVGIRRAG